MKQTSKIKTFALFLIICLSVFSFTAYAEEDDLYNDDVNSDVSQVDPGYDNTTGDIDNNDNNDTQTDYNDGNVSDDNSYDDYSDYGSSDSDSVVSDNSDDGNTDYGNNDNNNYDGYDSYEDNNSYEDYNSYDYNNSYDENSNYDENSDYNYNSGDYQTPSEVNLYKTDNSVDDPELSDSDWNSIALSLQNAENTDDGDDFNFIKKNNSSSDNGLWMLILGAVLVILSIIGIAYATITYLNNKKKLAYAGSSGAHNSSAKRTNSRSSYKAKNDYDDGFSISKRKSKKLTSRNRIDDTADIILPKNKNNRNRYR